MNNSTTDIPEELSVALLARVPSMLAYFDRTLTCRFANEAYAATLGVTPKEARGRSMAELLGAEDFAWRKARVERVLAGDSQRFEHVLESEGKSRHLLVSYVPDEVDGAVRGFVTEVTDVSSLRAAEQALRNSEARFRSLSESSPLGVYFTDAEGRREYMNPRWQEIYGLSESLGRGDGWMRALHEDDRDAVVDAWRGMAASGRELDLSFRIRRGSDGEIRVLRTKARPVRDAGGALIGQVGVLEDITDRRAGEERLRSSEAFLDRMGRIARIGGWEVDLRTRESRWSAETRRICEVDEDYVPPFLGGDHFYPPYAWEELSIAIDEAVNLGHGWDLELPFVTARGRHLWVRVLGEAELEDGVAVRLLGALQDVTEQRRQKADFAREQELRLQSERHAVELDRLLRERSEMLDVMAHEVRQPLNNASAALQGAMAAMAELRESAAAPLSRAQAVLGKVIASIDNTLAVAMLLARPEPLHRADTDIDTLLDVSLADMPSGDRARIHVERSTGARTAPMDMSLMRLALRNLLSNALRCSPAGSAVVVRIGEVEEPPSLLIEVSNDGGPIPVAQLARLFQRGAKRQPEDMQPAQGLGLGLYIVRRVMELHGGSAELIANEAGRVAFALKLSLLED